MPPPPRRQRRGSTCSDDASYRSSCWWSPPHVVQSFEPYDPTDIGVDGTVFGDCGDGASGCESGYTFMRGGTQIRATADQQDATHDYVYLVYDPSIPGTEVPSGTTYGSVTSEDLPAKFHQDVGSQSGIYFFRLNGATGSHTTPTLIDDPRGPGRVAAVPGHLGGRRKHARDLVG